MAKEITFTRKIEADGAAIRLYASKGGSIAPEMEYVGIYLENGDVEAKITIRDFSVLKQISEMCNDALKELNGGNDGEIDN